MQVNYTTKMTDKLEISAFACTCSPENLEDYKKLVVKMFEDFYSDTSLHFNTFEEWLDYIGYSLTDTCTYILDDLSYGITGIITDQWSSMTLANCYDSKNPTFYIQYDNFIFGVALTYFLIKSLKNNEILFDNNESIVYTIEA